ncbi:hypothetical protein GMOD_00010188 [Pyrenophora seminiperda CCB06]|uniref:Uncharacterized protein n=1 Tax=Pyrenophora seminiperda CCB06 TaxID=1302712 RepID=A0A3M7M5L8_9PLEO|nr:hypothetical protein GMOD_00010188 [Pyrenophora seminiperda CCB06]
MPAFSRGGFTTPLMTLRLPSSLRAALFGTTGPSSRAAFFTPTTSTPSFRHTFRLTSTTPPPLRRYATFTNNDPVLRQCLQTRRPVLLYHAPPSKYYHFKVYGAALLSISIGAYSLHFSNDLKDADLPFFVRPTYLVVGAAFIAIGCYICTAPTNRMRAMEVVPGLQAGALQLRFFVRAVPWGRERVVRCSLGGATLTEKTEPLVRELVAAESFMKQDVWEDLRGLGGGRRVWTGLERWVYQKWMEFFLRFKFAVLRFGIAGVRVGGGREEWKVDCSGFLLEGGKGMLIFAHFLVGFGRLTRCLTAIDRLIEEE